MIKRRPARRPANRRPTTGQFAERNRFRRLGHETLEKRELLAADLLAIRPDNSGLLQDGDVMNVAPREFNLFFNGGANLSEATINSNTVRLVRSGGDGLFGNNNDIIVQLGYVGLVNPGTTDPSERQQIVMRPASSASWNATDERFAFPDDFYRIEIVGAGSQPLASIGGAPFGGGENVAINFRLDRGAQVVSVVPQPVTRDASGNLQQADNQIVVYFDDQLLNLNDAEDPKFFRLVNTSATLSGDDDTTLLPEFAVYDSATNSVTLTFATAIPEATYRLDIGASGGVNDSLSTAVRVGTLFNQNRFTHNGFLGDINGLNDDASDQDHYRLELTAGSQLAVVVTPHAGGLNLVAELVNQANTVLAAVTTVASNSGTFNFNVTTLGSYYLRIRSAGTSTGSYLIDASVTNNPVSTSDNNSSFATATSLGSLGAAGLTVSAAIQSQLVPLPPFPGGEDEPGHRDIQREIHLGSRGTSPRVPGAVQTIRYHFPASFPNATSPGESYLNQITAEERRIVRSIFDIYAHYSGYEFIETPSSGRAIGKTDLRAFEPSMPPGAAGGLGGGAGAIVSAAGNQDANRFFGDGFTGVMFHEIGHSIGLGHAYDLPANMGAGQPEDILPGDHDIVHLQRLSPPMSTDIDMYQFEVTETGRLSAETIAERLATPSLLSTVLTLYRQTDSGTRELVARNDRYFGNDSFIEFQLEPGTYFVGVSSTGNDNYDPNVPDSGYGGTTDGNYQLRLSFTADRGGALRDADGTAIDGDSDGTPGGVHQFWFQASDVDSTIFVDRANDPLLGGSGGDGSLADPFDRLDAALNAAASRIVVPVDAATAIVAGETFSINDGIVNAIFTFNAGGANPINLVGLTTAEDIAVAIATAITNSALNTVATATGRVVTLVNLDRLDLAGSSTLLNTPNLVRVAGNPGLDGNLLTTGDNHAYLVGTDTSGNPLRDGQEFLVPQGVTVMLDAGVLVKLRGANLDAGTSSVNLSRAASSIQVLGTPAAPVYLRSYHDDTFGGDSDGIGNSAQTGDFGGIVFRNDSDLEDQGIFLNHVTHLDVSHGGGRVFIDSNELVFAPIHLEDSRPTIRFNHISGNADSAISANPDSFDDSLGRIGPDIVGNFINNNTIDGLFVRIRTQLGSTLDKLNLPGRFDDSDITHVLTENLLISGNPGGALLTGSGLIARAAGRLVIDPGVVLKLSGSRIEAERGSSSLIAEGTANRPVIFTSMADDRYGGSGSFDTNADNFSLGAAGDWAGLYFGQTSTGHLDNVILTFGGGESTIEGSTAQFNVLEAHQADLRITNSLIRDNASGADGGVRNGRGANAGAVVYVRSGQPVIVGNTFIDNAGPVIHINANSLNYKLIPDYGRATGAIDIHEQFADNYGPLVRLNRLQGNTINGMLVRGGELTTESIWDDTDIVHVLQSEIRIDNHHTFSGLRLQSSNTESLVVKLSGASAGFTATGTPLETIDRIGGTIHVLGSPGFPVVLTHLADDTVGAGFAPDGTVMTNTNNTLTPSTGTIGGWRGLRFDEWSNDRNVAIYRESENSITNGKDINRTPLTAQQLGTLAPNEKSGDENRRLGFEVHGFISPDDPGDVDVYSFQGTAGTSIWIDIDRTDTNLDAIVEVINSNGTVVARSVRSGELSFPGNLNVAPLTQNPLLGGDFYTQNFRDPGLRYTLPGTAGSQGTYFVRVRSNPQTGPVTTLAGKSFGKYQLQIRLQQVDEFPGSTVRFADIRNAQTAIDVRGLPARSPMIGEAGETAGNSFNEAQQLVNLLQTDMAALGISGVLSGATDVDWYRFSVEHTGVQVIAGVNEDPGTVAVVFDLDYADSLNRPDATIAVYDPTGTLIWVGRESNVEDDQPLDATGNLNDLTRGSVGRKDPYIGPIHIRPTVTPPGGTMPTFYVAVMSNQQLPTELTGFYNSSAANGSVRLEPVNTSRRVVEDHFGFQGYTSNGAFVEPETVGGIFDLSNATTLASHVIPFDLSDVVTYVATDSGGDSPDDNLYTASIRERQDFLTRLRQNVGDGRNDVQDIVIRSDGAMFGYRRLESGVDSVGQLVRIDPSTGAFTAEVNDNIRGDGTTPNVSVFGPAALANRSQQFTTSNDVDAVTFRRLGDSGGGSPVPSYNVFYSVRESSSTSKLYRARPNGDATPTNGSGLNESRYGYLGHIQNPGVTNASSSMSIADGSNPTQFSTIGFFSKLPGIRGNSVTVRVTYEQTGSGARAQVMSASASTDVNPVVNLTIRYTRDGNGVVNGGPTAGQIVDAINGHVNARELMMAVITSGNTDTGMRNMQLNGTVVPIPLTGGTQGAAGVLTGRVTGLSFDNFASAGNLFGVTNTGEFLEIDPDTGTVFNRREIFDAAGNPFVFQGLALGPQNVSDGVSLANQGIYRNTLFAITSSGEVVALDRQGNPVYAFESNNSSQLLTVTGNPSENSFFTLTFNNGTSRQTTEPIAANAPSSASVNERQTISTNAYAGTFTLSYEKNQGAVTSLSAPINSVSTPFIQVQSVSDQPFTAQWPATPFVIRVQNEEMRVTSRSGNNFTVDRGFHGTTPTTHPDTASVYEVVSTLLTTPLPDSPTSLLTRSELLTVSSPLTISSPLAADINSASLVLTVNDASAFPLVPFPVQVNSEQMLVTNVNVGANQITVNRAEAGTFPADHAAGSHVQVLAPALGTIIGINNSAGTLRIRNAASFPNVPFVIRIDSEEMLVNAVDLVNNELAVTRSHNATLAAAHNVGQPVRVLPVAGTTSGASINDTVTTLEVVDASNTNYPATPFVVRVNGEEMLVTNRNVGANTLTVTRGHNGTIEASHDIGSPVQILPAAGSTFVAINALTTNIRVVDVSTFPVTTPFNIRVNDELMTVTNVDSILDELTVIRGQLGSNAAAHNLGSVVEVLVASSSLTATVANNPGANILSVFDASVYPPTPFTIRVNREEMLVASVNLVTNQLTVVRGSNGTAIETHHAPRLATVVSDSINVATVAPFPVSTPYNIRIGQEDLRVTGRTGNQLNVIRGINGTERVGHSASERVRYIETTAPINYNATAAQVATALRNLPGIQNGDIVVSPFDGPLTGTAAGTVTIEFAQNLGKKDLAPLTTDTTRLRANEVQEIVLADTIDGGTFTLTYAGLTTGPILHNANVATVRLALESLANIGTGNVIVTGGTFPGSAMQVEFVETLGKQNIASQITVSNDQLANNERQQLRINGGPTGGLFRLALNGVPTGDILWNAAPAAVQTALEGIVGIGVGNVSVTGSNMPGGTMQIEFIGARADTNVSTLTFTNAFTGGTAPTVAITVLEEGNINNQATTSTVINGALVSAPITTDVDGARSIRDALVGLSTIANADINVSGDLQAGGVVVLFTGALAGTDWTALEVDNTEMTGGAANIAIEGVAGDGVPDAFVSRVTNMAGTPTGIAFSPLDFNLWHPTMRRSSEAGHGINVAPDGSRFPGDVGVEVPIADGNVREINEGVGGVSMYFGFEQWSQSQTTTQSVYLPMNTGANSQFGILNTDQHKDLSSNPAIVGTYNLPGGALGSLVSSSFSLANATRADRPTLYFNYYLATQGHPGSDVSSDGSDPFRDSARVFASRNNGLTWQLLATNSSELSGADPGDDSQRAELPGFLSHLSDAALNSDTPRGEPHQIVQELMDNSGQWRQARVDLSTYAGAANILLRFDFSTAGAMDDASLGAIDANFGEFRSEIRSIRSSDNQHEGFYIDDIIVGFAERGEMVTGVTTPRRTATNLAASGARTADRDPAAFANSLTGAYQLEIRRTDDVATWIEEVGIGLNNIFDTNDRQINSVAVTAFEGFEPITTVDTSLPPAVEVAALIEDLTGTAIPVLAIPTVIREWEVQNSRVITGTQSLASPVLSAPQAGALYQTTPAELGSTATGRGLIRFKYSVSSLDHVHGLVFLIDGVPQLLVPQVHAHEGGVSSPPEILASGELRNVTVEFPFVSETSVLTWIYNFADPQAPDGANQAWIDDIEILQGDGATGFESDRNRHRPQGIFIIESNTITNSESGGINVQPGMTQGGGSVPHPGSTINFAQVNNDRLVPGVVIQNNIIAGSSAIRFAGETTASPQRPVPFGRIVNNTLVGRGTGTGVQVVGIASPTIINNVITGFTTGIAGTVNTTTVTRSNYFQGNGTNGPLGTGSTVQPPGTPLFVDAAAGNYYLVSGSSAVDSSLDTLQDRFNYVNFKAELGIPASPISAPDRDVYGQKRVDSGQSPGGGGASVFKDRGAVDRSDFDAPFAVLLDPVDNDITGLDQDPNLTVVSLNDPILEAFSILLADGRGPNAPFEGTGVDPATVSTAVVTVRRNNVTLTAGLDYVLGFNGSTSEMRLTPLSTLWEPSGVYEITLNNQVIRDRAGNRLRSNQADGSTRFWIILPEVGLDYGDANTTFGTLLVNNGARHAIINDASPRLGNFVDAESNGQPGSVSNSDDLPRPIVASVNPGSSLTVNGSGTPNLEILVNAPVTVRDSIRINNGHEEYVFELVTSTIAPGIGNIAVRYDFADSGETIAAKLSDAIRNQFQAPGSSFTVSVPSSVVLETTATSPHEFTLELTPDSVGGSFDLDFAADLGLGIVAGSVTIPWNASAAQVQTALQAIGGLAGNVTVQGGPLPAEPITITFGGTLTGNVIPSPTVNSMALVADPATITTTLDTVGGRAFEFELSDNTLGGTFTLSVAGGSGPLGTTPAIDFDADPLTILAALESIDSSLAGRLAVTRDPVDSSLFRVQFLLNLASSSLNITANGTNLTVLDADVTLTPIAYQSQQVSITIPASVAGGSFVLSLNDLANGISGSSTPIAFDADEVVIQAALEAITLADGVTPALTGNITVTTVNPGEFLVTFVGGLAGITVAPFTVVSDLQTAIRLENLDDEDGVGVSTLTIGVNDYIVFSRPDGSAHPAYPNSIPDTSQVLGFLNPLDPAGTQISITVQGTGFIDAWIDFNNNGVFEAVSEKVLNSVAVADGLNTFTILTPTSALNGTRTMRVRVSPEGGLQPTGLAVGGEVEDYQVEVIRVAPVAAMNDNYTMLEDGILDTSAGGLSVGNNDGLGALLPFVPRQFIEVTGPSNAATFSLDPLTGHFIYEPLADFAGIDTFTYYVALQQSAIDADITVTLPNIVTVTIDVRPVNDAPLAPSQRFVTLESQPTPVAGDPLVIDLDNLPVSSDFTGVAIVSSLNDSLEPLLVVTPVAAGSLDFTVTLPGGTDNGSYVIQLLDSQGDLVGQTQPIAWDASAGEVSDALAAVTEIGSAIITVTGGAFLPAPPQVGRGPHPLTITAADLLANALADANPSFPVGAAAAPWDETNQFLRVVEVILPDGSVINSLNPNIHPGTGEVTFVTIHRTATLRFALTNGAGFAQSAGSLLDIVYRSNNYWNRDNVTLQSVDRGDGTAVSVFDYFRYTIEDDGQVIDPAQVNTPPNLPVILTNVTTTEPRLRHTAIAVIDVAPQNDHPIPSATSENLVSVGPVGSGILQPDGTTFYPIDATTPWSLFFKPVVAEISVGILSTDTVVSVLDAAALPTTLPFDIRINNEVLTVTAVDTVLNQLTVTRGAGAADHAIGDDVRLDLAVPVPTEDTQLFIPAQFLLQSDRVGQLLLSTDEERGFNDGDLRIIEVTMVTAPASGGGSVSLDANGNVLFRAPTDAYGEVVFTYVIEDTGIDEDVAGDRVENRLTATGTVTVVVQPVNDNPIAYERALQFVESGDPVRDAFEITPADFLIGTAPEVPAIPGTETTGLDDDFAELEQTSTLRVVAFGTAAGTVDVADLLNYNGPGTGSGSLHLFLTSDNNGPADARFEFDFEDGALTEARFIPAADYNLRTPFNLVELLTFVIEDNGRTTDPQNPANVVFLPAERSAPQTLTISVGQTNDAPIFTLDELPAEILGYSFPAGSFGFVFDENEGQDVVVENFVTFVAPGAFTALDELERQNVFFTVTPENVPAGMMRQDPVIDVTAGGPNNWTDADGLGIGAARLTIFPASDAFGFAVYVVTATDLPGADEATGFVARTTSMTITIAINPINDVPVAFDRLLTDVEAVETDGEVTVIPFDAARLIDGLPPELPSVAGLFDPIPSVSFNETEQTRRVVAFGVPGAADVDAAIDEDGLENGSGTVTRTTVTGGTLTFTFVNGAFTAGSYAPAIDYNERTPFDPSVDLFTFIVSDNGRTTLPGSDSVNYAGSNVNTTITLPDERSEPATVTITVTQANDTPIFTLDELPAEILGYSFPAGSFGFVFDENEGQDVVVENFVTFVAPGAFTALDELDRQNVVFTITPENVPPGMMRQDPVIDVTAGGPNNWTDADGLGIGAARLTIFPASDAFGFAVYVVTATDLPGGDEATDFVARTTSMTITIAINPINDVPVAFDRTFIDTEAVEVDGEVTVINFTAANLINGSGLETPNVAGNFPITLIDPYNETEQTLRVVAFAIPGVDSIDVNDLPLGTGTVTRTTVNGGQLIFNFENGAFVDGSYTPTINYNQRSPFVSPDLFTYVISDNGQTTLAGSGFVNLNGDSNDTVLHLDDERALAATVTLTILQRNDPPIYNFEPLVNILERDDSGVTVVTNWATDILPSELTALDELQRQTVSFSFVVGDSIVPAGLFRLDPQVSPDGTLSLFPARDAVGTATIVMRATDFENTVGFVPRSTDATFTVNVQPVNDPPVFDPARLNTSDVDDVNDDYQWEVKNDGTIVYTLPENNLQSGGAPVDFFIPLRGTNLVNAYNQIGLLDVFVVGPTNEADVTPGGSQTVSLNTSPPFPLSTQRGGTLTPVLNSTDVLIGFNYQPPQDFNFVNSGLDRFTYSVIDNGQTYVLATTLFENGELVDDPRTATGRVELRLNPTNNRPQFSIGAPYFEAAEDTDQISIAGFATSIMPGPPSAIDESNQTVRFELNPLSFTRGGTDDPFGAGYPEISDFGSLTFQPLRDAFGVFLFEVLAIDSGPDDPIRGDLNTSLPQTITIQIQPTNDRPVLVPNPVPLRYEQLEDRSIDLPLAGFDGNLGLLDNFRVGPANEMSAIVGGNQMLSLIVPFPPSTGQNGSLEPIFNSDGVMTHLRYTPRQHFVGIDTFTFVAMDNGVSVDVGTGGATRPDPLSITGSVTINVLPVNDRPQFFGGGNVASTEDQGLVTIQNWATGIQAGPAGANDERNGTIVGLPSVAPQTLSFEITQILSEGSTVFAPMFTTLPTATIVGNNARLNYQTAPDANGIAIFEVVLRDNGGSDPDRGDINSTVPRTFTITVGAVNDPPQFTAGPIITIDEVDQDGVEFTFAWAQDILLGPITAIDEIATQTVSFDVTTPAGSVALFETDGLPAIDDAGFVTFTPARFAAGQAVVQVVAVDSQGARSAPISLTINITDINNIPVASDIVLNSDEDNLLRIVPSQLLDLVIDPDLISNPNETLTIIDVDGTTSLAGASITVGSDGRIVYDPLPSSTLQRLAPGETFRDHFTYRVRDRAGEISNVASNVATVFVDVAGINDAPVATSFTVLAATGEEVIISLLVNNRATDIDGDIDLTSIFITRQPTNGILVVRPDGTLSYTPIGTFEGQDSFGYTIADNLGQQSTQETITIDVAPSADAANGLIGSWLVTPTIIDVTESVTPTEVALDLSSVEIVTEPQNGTVTFLPDGTITYVADDGFSGTDSFQYRIYDVEGRPSSVATVTVQVVASPAQNPTSFRDVNADGTVEPFDALLILTRFGQAQQQGISGSLPADMVADEAPLRFYDVDGNGFVEPLDALLVLLQIAEQNRNRGLSEGESVAWTDPVIVAGFNTTTGTQTTMAELRREAEFEFEPINEPVNGPVQSFDWEDDDFELLAVGVAETREEKQSESDTDLIDAVWGNLF